MDYSVKILSFLWAIRTLKFVLFWLYLWQLKEYHIPRFIDHFRTYKGKRIFFNLFFISKLILFLLLLLSYYVFGFVSYVLFLIYAVESLVFLSGFFKNNIKRPVFTHKTILLTTSSVLLVSGLFLSAYNNINSDFWFVFSILAIDIFIPVIVTAVVLFFQPFFVFLRNRIIKKATERVAEFDKLVVIGITGSYGKTSTKEFLTTILSRRFNVLATKEHQNSEMGIASCILENLNKDHQIFIVEMGAYKKGGISLLCNMVKPMMGIVTGVNEQHLSLFGSMENILSAEGGGELLEKLPKNGLIAVNGDNKYCIDLYDKATIHKRIYSEKGDRINSDIWAEEISVKKESLDFMAINNKKEIGHFDVKILGRHNIQNLLGAILIAKELGMSFSEISKAVKDIKQEQGGMLLKPGTHGINIVDSSYSSNPDGVMADLDYLKAFKGKRVVVMPCLIELGKKSKEVHRQIGKKLAEISDMVIVTTKERFQDIKDSATHEDMQEDKIIFSANADEIFHTITTFCKSGDVVLLEGRVPDKLIKLLTEK